MIRLKEEKKQVKSARVVGGVGRRKSSVARVWVRPGTGGVAINGKRCADYFNTDETRSNAIKSLVVCGAVSHYDVVVNVQGGGKCSQSDAVRLGVARALVSIDEELRGTLRENGLLTVDSRLKERKKPGQKAARRKFQFVKR